MDNTKELAHRIAVEGQYVGETRELIAQTFIADKNYIIREPKEPYQTDELKWFISQSRYIKDLGEIAGFIPKIWQQIAEPDGKVNSNYGWAALSPENGSQWDNAMQHLVLDRNSRRALLVYNRPSMHTDWAANREHEEDGWVFDFETADEKRENYGKIRGDFMCCQNNHFLIRGDKLIMLVQMRSLDAVFGYNADYKWFDYLFDKSVTYLKGFYPELTRGDMIITADSVHVYKRHWKILDSFITSDDDQKIAEEQFKQYQYEQYGKPKHPAVAKDIKEPESEPENGLSSDPTKEARYSHNGVQHWDIAINHGWGYLIGNASKYIYRCRYKGSFPSDLIKAERYLDKFDEVRTKAGQPSFFASLTTDEISGLSDRERVYLQEVNRYLNQFSSVQSHPTQPSFFVEMADEEMSDLNERERQIIKSINRLSATTDSEEYNNLFCAIKDELDNYSKGL